MKQQSNKKRPENASARVQNFKIFWGSMPPDPQRVENPSGLRQIYPHVTLKYPLVQKLIETPGFPTFCRKKIVKTTEKFRGHEVSLKASFSQASPLSEVLRRLIVGDKYLDNTSSVLSYRSVRTFQFLAFFVPNRFPLNKESLC